MDDLDLRVIVLSALGINATQMVIEEIVRRLAAEARARGFAAGEAA